MTDHIFLNSEKEPKGKIGVMAPSSYIERDDIEKSKAALEARGYEVFIHPQTFERETREDGTQSQSAGDVLQKSLALQGLWQREDIDVIWAAGGGNRAMMLLDTLNFAKMQGKRKTLVGFSDCTPLLNAIYANTGYTTFHAPVFKQLHDHQNLDDILALLGGDTPAYPFDTADILKPGEASGILVGGCLSLFHLLPGTTGCPDLEGAILFLEDTGDHASRFDRMIYDLRRMSVFEQISGLILGEFHDVQDGAREFGHSINDIVTEHTNGFDFPIISNAPFGHGKNNWPLPIGRTAHLKADDHVHFHLI